MVLLSLSMCLDKGVIIGSGWQSAPNISEEFRKIAIGSLPYETLPEVSS